MFRCLHCPALGEILPAGLFLCKDREIGRKDLMMKLKENVMEVMAIGVEKPEEDCEIITEIARKAAMNFELAAEFQFDDDEDDDIANMIKELYEAKKYALAVDLLNVSFRLCGMYDEAEEIALVYKCRKANADEKFIRAFIAESLRCSFAEFRGQHPALFS